MSTDVDPIDAAKMIDTEHITRGCCWPDLLIQIYAPYRIERLRVNDPELVELARRRLPARVPIEPLENAPTPCAWEVVWEMERES